MNFREWFQKHGWFSITVMLILGATIVAGSFVFDPPDHLQGTVIEKIYIPSNLQISDAPVRRGRYYVKAVREEQWIAIVVTDKGDTLKVHCDPKHYGTRNVGDRIKFRDYEGSLIHIDYFAHAEEEGEEKK